MELTNKLANLYHDIILQKKCTTEETIHSALLQSKYSPDSATVLTKHLMAYLPSNTQDEPKKTLPETTTSSETIKEDTSKPKIVSGKVPKGKAPSLTKKISASTSDIKFPLEVKPRDEVVGKLGSNLKSQV